LDIRILWISCHIPIKILSNIGLENIKLNSMTDKIRLYHQPATYESIRNLITQYDLKDIFLKIDV
jgi:hypothetical protein